MKVQKDWIGTQESIYKMLGASNHTNETREANDYYSTDPQAIIKLLQRESFNNNVWECAVGGGHLANVLINQGFNVKASDIVNRGFKNTEIIDFLKTDIKFDGDIITNPPYKLCEEFILKALHSVADGNKVAMFLKLQTLEGQSRYNNVFSKYPPQKIYVFIKRIECAKNGEFKGSSAVCYAWFVWEKGNTGNTIIKWI